METKANLGLATTGELIDEIRARVEVDGTIDYRTVGPAPEPQSPPQEFKVGDRLEIVAVLDEDAYFKVGDIGTRCVGGVHMENGNFASGPYYTWKLIHHAPKKDALDKADDRLRVMEIMQKFDEFRELVVNWVEKEEG